MASITGTNKADLVTTTAVSPGVAGGPAPAGADRILLGNGDDEARGGGGADEIRGENGDDRLLGENGNDRLFGENGNDEARGGEGHDRLFGENGDDELRGDGGRDRLDGGHGDDTLTGGTGDDTFVLSKGDDTVTDLASGPAATTLVDFEGLIGADGIAWIPDGYEGLDWTNAAVIGEDHYPVPSGYENVVRSGVVAGFDNAEGGASFAAAQDFDFESAWFAAAWRNDLTLTVQAFDDGVQVGTATIVLDPAPVFVDLAAGTATGADGFVLEGRFTSIDEVRIDGAGGTYAGFGVDGAHVAMDDLQLRFGQHDVIDVPDGTDVAALVASARSDGAGGTILTHAGGTLTLEHVAPGDVAADWFV